MFNSTIQCHLGRSPSLSMTPDEIKMLYQFLEENYPRLPYHNLEHALSVATMVASSCEYNQDGDEALIAALFHDIIYDPLRVDNEIGSAVMAKDYIADNIPYFNSNFADGVFDKIVATDHKYFSYDYSGATKVLLDADLMGLSSPPHIFQANSVRIRNEFCHLTDNQFYAGRLKWIEMMIGRGYIYYDASRNEDRAIENLVNERKVALHIIYGR